MRVKTGAKPTHEPSKVKELRMRMPALPRRLPREPRPATRLAGRHPCGYTRGPQIFEHKSGKRVVWLAGEIAGWAILGFQAGGKPLGGCQRTGAFLTVLPRAHRAV